MFHKEGYKIIFTTLVIVIGSILIIDRYVDITWLRLPLMTVMLMLLILILQFFRNPKRHTTLDSNAVVSPVDGKVVVIEEVFENEVFKDKRIQVSVFMSPIQNIIPESFSLLGIQNLVKKMNAQLLL